MSTDLQKRMKEDFEYSLQLSREQDRDREELKMLKNILAGWSPRLPVKRGEIYRAETAEDIDALLPELAPVRAITGYYDGFAFAAGFPDNKPGKRWSELVRSVRDENLTGIIKFKGGNTMALTLYPVPDDGSRGMTMSIRAENAEVYATWIQIWINSRIK